MLVENKLKAYILGWLEGRHIDCYIMLEEQTIQVSRQQSITLDESLEPQLTAPSHFQHVVTTILIMMETCGVSHCGPLGAIAIWRTSDTVINKSHHADVNRVLQGETGRHHYLHLYQKHGESTIYTHRIYKERCRGNAICDHTIYKEKQEDITIFSIRLLLSALPVARTFIERGQETVLSVPSYILQGETEASLYALI